MSIEHYEQRERAMTMAVDLAGRGAIEATNIVTTANELLAFLIGEREAPSPEKSQVASWRFP